MFSFGKDLYQLSDSEIKVWEDKKVVTQQKLENKRFLNFTNYDTHRERKFLC